MQGIDLMFARRYGFSISRQELLVLLLVVGTHNGAHSTEYGSPPFVMEEAYLSVGELTPDRACVRTNSVGTAASKIEQLMRLEKQSVIAEMENGTGERAFSQILTRSRNANGYQISVELNR